MSESLQTKVKSKQNNHNDTNHHLYVMDTFTYLQIQMNNFWSKGHIDEQLKHDYWITSKYKQKQQRKRTDNYFAHLWGKDKNHKHSNDVKTIRHANVIDSYQAFKTEHQRLKALIYHRYVPYLLVLSGSKNTVAKYAKQSMHHYQKQHQKWLTYYQNKKVPYAGQSIMVLDHPHMTHDKSWYELLATGSTKINHNNIIPHVLIIKTNEPIKKFLASGNMKMNKHTGTINKYGMQILFIHGHGAGLDEIRQ